MSRATRTSASLVAGLAVLCLLGAGVGELAAKATEADLAKVRVGMDRTQVLQIMGQPDKDQRVTGEEELCRLYVYEKVGRYKIVNIWFSCQDKVEAIDKVG